MDSLEDDLECDLFDLLEMDEVLDDADLTLNPDSLESDTFLCRDSSGLKWNVLEMFIYNYFNHSTGETCLD